MRSSSADRRSSAKRIISGCAKVGERAPTPQREGLCERVAGTSRVAGRECGAPLGHELLEPIEVELTRSDSDLVAPAMREQHAVTERLAQVRYIPLQGLGGRSGRALAPELIDQSLARHGLGAM